MAYQDTKARLEELRAKDEAELTAEERKELEDLENAEESEEDSAEAEKEAAV